MLSCSTTVLRRQTTWANGHPAFIFSNHFFVALGIGDALGAKCANNHAIASRSPVLQPQQLGAGVSGGAEAAVHATIRLAKNLSSDHGIVQLDFSNAFNCVRREVILDAVAAEMPDIYCLVHAAYSCEPILVYAKHQVRSSEGSQRGEPVGHLNSAKLFIPYVQHYGRCQGVHSCPWHCRGGMRSHFKTHSPPASSLQSVVSFLNVLVPTGFLLVGHNNNSKKKKTEFYSAVMF